ncbi:MAG: STAS domain-containing protein [Vampirovibrionales bacterium]|nr:STAS domain-containing protein [Vampirovibrionales bacterium]
MKTSKNKDTLRLTPEQDWHVSTVDAEQKAIEKALQSKTSGEVLLDLTQIDQMDSMGLKLLVGLYKTCVKKGLKLRVEASSSKILRLTRLCGLNQYIEIQEVVAHG